LDKEESVQIKRFMRWHIVYLLTVAVFFTVIYFTGLFRSNIFLKEKALFLIIAPVATALFVLVSPWRDKWFNAVGSMYSRLEGQGVYCVLAAFVFVFGFLIYSIFIWGLGALVPSLVYM
jgi:hypothetical protein